MKTLKILAVDDHQMTMIGYKYILEDAEFEDFTVAMEMATTFEEGKQKIEQSVANSPVVDGVPSTGQDLGVIARNISPTSKIVFLSSFSDNYRINSILRTVNPEGYMVKTEINEIVLKEMVETVLTSPPYYTKKALIAIRNKMSTNIHLDDTDIKILYYLSVGTRTKDMGDYVPLSISAIENRKRQIKEIFGVENENDNALIASAKEKGFI